MHARVPRCVPRARGMLMPAPWKSTAVGARISARLSSRKPSTDARGGSFSANLASLGDFDALNRQLESGGFRERQVVHVAQGDLTLGAAESIVAREVNLATDAGALIIAGFIDATSDNQRGRIELRAGGDLTLASTARVRALGAGALGRGGSLVLESTSGDVNLRTGSQIALSGAPCNPDSLTVRAAATDDGMRVGDLNSEVRGINVIALQPVLRYDVAGMLTDEDFSIIRDQVATFIADAAPGLRSRYANLVIPVAIRPGIELDVLLAISTSNTNIVLWRTTWTSRRGDSAAKRRQSPSTPPDQSTSPEPSAMASAPEPKRAP